MFKLRPYQKEAVIRAINYFKKSRFPGLIVLPTGAGKSIVIAELSRIAKGRVLILTHVKELVEQNHSKYQSYGLQAGIYSAGLNKKQTIEKVIFASIQSTANANDDFFDTFNLVIIDECHRIAEDNDSQYQNVIKKLKNFNPQLCVLGLTATPYRLGLGWIYEYHYQGEIKSQEKRFFKECIYELPISYMIKNKYLTPPLKIDLPVTCYDFSELTSKGRMYRQSEVEEILKNQKRLTPLIIKNIIDIAESYHRKAVMLFASTVNHAKEIMQYLPQDQSALILGETSLQERDEIINSFKKQKFKYLVNVSVLTTGFDASHVDVIAILRPTESVSLYQQIIGRGLRLSPEKENCYVLDYTGMGHSIYTPEVGDKKVNKDSTAVLITCPRCGFENTFWGIKDQDGVVTEHFGRKCKGARQDAITLEIIPCNFRFRYKICHHCGGENDISARKCETCHTELVDADTKLKQAKLSKNTHIFKPDHMQLNQREDKNGVKYLEIKYFDFDGQYLQEIHYLNNPSNIQKFKINFLRSHQKLPGQKVELKKLNHVLDYSKNFRIPIFLIARKQDKYWRITEKIFSEEISSSRGTIEV